MTDGRLRQLFKQHMPDFDWQAIETTIGRGIPDLNGCIDGQEIWVEQKLTKGRRVTVTPEQVGWIERRLRHGGKVFIAVRRMVGKEDELYLVHGHHARALSLGAWPETLCLDFWTNGPAHWNWRDVKDILLGK